MPSCRPEKERIVSDIPAEILPQAQEARRAMIEKLADFDDDIAELYLEDAEIEEPMLRKAIREATIKLLVTPYNEKNQFQYPLFKCNRYDYIVPSAEKD